MLFAAPLVYLVGHGIAALVTLGRRRFGAYAVVPLALLAGLEGADPQWRVTPIQTVEVVRTVAASPAEVESRIAGGPQLTVTPKPWLLAAMPLPTHTFGTGIEAGDRWLFHFGGDRHGPGGELIIEVAAHASGPEGGSVDFRRVSDTSIVARWLDWSGARLSWRAVGGGTEVTLTMTFVRGLDPSWYFGPVEDMMVGSAAGFLLESLGLGEQ